MVIRDQIKRAVVRVHHQLVTIALDDAIRSGNDARAQRLAAEECRLRAELAPIGTAQLLDDYELVEHQDWLGRPGSVPK